MASYPLQGIYKSVWTSAQPNTQRSIVLAQHAEGAYLAAKARVDGIDDHVVMKSFEAMTQRNLTSGRLGLHGAVKGGIMG